MIEEKSSLKIDEQTILSKFNGDSTEPEDEFERVTVVNGIVVAHDVIENGEVTGSVEGSDLLGRDIGRLYTEPEKEDN